MTNINTKRGVPIRISWCIQRVAGALHPIAIALTLIVIMLAIDARAANLHRDYGYSIIRIRLLITLTSPSPLSPPIKGGIKAYSMSVIT
jgi:hypothetical protein